MSVEAPKGNQGCLPRFLRRFITEASEPQPIPQSKPSVVQPPLGLENFADQIRSVVDGRLTAQRQKEHDIEAAKAAQIAASIEADRKAAEALSKPYRDEEDRKYREKQEQIAKELAAVLEKFRVVERLGYIRDTVWGGKGEIRPVGGKVSVAGKKANYTHQNDAYNHETDRGGLELVYQYPSVKLLDSPKIEGRFNIEGSSSPGSPHMQKYVPDTNSTALRVKVLDTEQDSGEDKKELRISSVTVLSPGCRIFVSDFEFFSVCMPREKDESEALLEVALKQETIKRVDDGLLPSQLEKSARKMLIEAQRGPNWQKWKEVK